MVLATIEALVWITTNHNCQTDGGAANTAEMGTGNLSRTNRLCCQSGTETDAWLKYRNSRNRRGPAHVPHKSACFKCSDSRGYEAVAAVVCLYTAHDGEDSQALSVLGGRIRTECSYFGFNFHRSSSSHHHLAVPGTETFIEAHTLNRWSTMKDIKPNEKPI